MEKQLLYWRFYLVARFINTYKEDLIMSKAILHNLIDMLNEADTETIYNVLVKFVPAAAPSDDEIEAIKQAETDIKNGDVFDISAITW